MRATGCGAATPQSTSRDTEIGGSHMSQKDSTALGVSAAMGGAAVAAFLGMGTAHAAVRHRRRTRTFRGPPARRWVRLQRTQGADNATWTRSWLRPNPGHARRSTRTSTRSKPTREHGIDGPDQRDRPQRVLRARSTPTSLATYGTSPVARTWFRTTSSATSPRIWTTFLLNPTGLDFAAQARSIDILLGFPGLSLIRNKSTSGRGGCLDRWGWGATSPPVQTPNVEPAAVNPGAPGVR